VAEVAQAIEKTRILKRLFLGRPAAVLNDLQEFGMVVVGC
jgi:hypothetical protein